MLITPNPNKQKTRPKPIVAHTKAKKHGNQACDILLHIRVLDNFTLLVFKELHDMFQNIVLTAHLKCQWENDVVILDRKYNYLRGQQRSHKETKFTRSAFR